ncbi:hypothetical protein AVEN_252830-1 [Araneus ventricosus]|uniref:Transposase Tc1-like domain-containing protein n=1 Tax=Araneus ventricosus TaxID=182803 RepID=A0A4Y2CKE3_ARAVE|nr:hypothetical protein AVEN_252830-1 [Araneus ventricosus]
MGFGSRRPTRVTLLNARHRAARLAWAREQREWTLDDWKRVAWSDKSSFRLLQADVGLRIWRQAHEAMDPACQVGTVQGHGGSIMVWGVLSWQILGSLVLVPTSLNEIRYVKLLGDHLHPFMLYCHAHGNGVLQQDNRTSRRSRLATAWLDEHSSDFSVMNWPPRSPTLILLSTWRMFWRKWIPSHVDLFFNDLADELVMEGSAEPLDNRGLLTYSEIFSKVRADSNRTWRIPSIHDWCQQKHSGAALELKGDRKLQTTITRFISGHTRTLSYVQGQKVFPVCLKCNTHQSTPDHLLSCMEQVKRNLFESPALVRDFLWASGLLDLA